MQKLELQKQRDIAFLKTGTCRELAGVPSDTVFNEFYDPVFSEGEVLQVVIPKKGTSYHRSGCRCLQPYNKHSVVSIYNITAAYYGPCSVCKPVSPRPAPLWLHKYKHFLSLKQKYNLEDPDIYPGSLPVLF